MQDVKAPLREALKTALERLGVEPPATIPVEPAPKGKPGDYGTPLPFQLARRLKKPPPEIARALAEALPPLPGLAEALPVGGFLNFRLEPGYLVGLATEPPAPRPPSGGKVLLEHTSVNPNKELHIGHLRNVALGDAMARILAYAGRVVEVANYIDDTGRQAAESLFAIARYREAPGEGEKYDHFAGRLYVRLHRELGEEGKKEVLEPEIREVLRRLEAGELRAEVERILTAQLATMWRLGAEYDVLLWESDIVREGLLEKALALLKTTPYVLEPEEGKYRGALVFDTSKFIPGLEDPYLVLVRSDGTATYTAKDIALQFWKMGLLSGLKFRPYTAQPSGRPLFTSHPQGEPMPFGGASETINVIDVRQSYPQEVLKAALRALGRDDLAAGHHHLAYETVLLEGRPLSGRKGHVVSVDALVQEAVARARAIVAEKNPDHPDPELAAEQVGIGAIRFAMVKAEPRRQIDFRWDQALSFEGDAGPYLQYAHARAASILRKAREKGLDPEAPLPEGAVGTAGGYEVALAKVLLGFPEAVGKSAVERTPHLLAAHLLDLAAAWNAYYNAKEDGQPATPVLAAPEGLRELRLRLVWVVKETLRQGLALLGVPAPEVM